jgi:DNA (cytosine-5)-methyltransferase 1
MSHSCPDVCDTAAVPRPTATSGVHAPLGVTRPTAIDLYAGAGGLSLGLEQAGFDVLVAAEVDPIHAATHLYNFPNCEVVCRDLGSVNSRDLLLAAELGWRRVNPFLPWPGSVDAVVGGPPCQGFSVGGIRDQSDARNDQLRRFGELVVELRPRVFLLENVVGLLEERFDQLRGEVFASLEEAGYTLAGHRDRVNAVDFGVPQLRRRVLIFGTLDRANLVRLSPLSRRTTVGDALAGLPQLTLYRRLLSSDCVELKLADIELRSNTASLYARLLNGLEVDEDDYSHSRTWDPAWLTNSLRTVHSARTRQRFSRTEPGSEEPVSRLFRLHPDRSARTLRAGTGSERGAHTSPRPIHPSYDRVITVREAARLHGYPDWFRFHSTNWHGHRQVGNSVPPPLGRAAGAALLAALGLEPRRSTAPDAQNPPEALLRLNRASAANFFGVLPVSPRPSRTASPRNLRAAGPREEP